jgi:osmotically-inducible protein OsmY
MNSTHSIQNKKNAGFTRVPGARQRFLKCRTLLWLALPLTLAAGCVSSPSGGDRFFSDPPAAVAAPVTSRHIADQTIADELFQLSLDDTAFEYSRIAAVNDGVVTLRGPIPYDGEQYPDGNQQYNINDEIMALAGVNRVKDELGTNTAATVAFKTENLQPTPNQ